MNLAAAVDRHGWDGDWYIRAFDDDGIAWGSSENDECRIDLIAQAWSVLSGLPVDARARKALTSAGAALVDDDARLIRLLTPPFDTTDRDPGYIQAYPPGVRENGGQYTHAAAWLGLAYAKIKDGDRAHHVFDLINPIARTSTLKAADHYRREPYVLSGDVSGVGAQIGQGGWSWYTGAAGWNLAVRCHRYPWDSAGSWRRAVGPLPAARLGAGGGHPRKRAGPDRITIKDPDNIGHGELQIVADQCAVEGASIRSPGKGRKCQVVATIYGSQTPVGIG